ncbi:MAG: hypothetical protein ACTSSH_00750 [Candidatus Heimdallarchaeota archaeon]
MKLKAKTITVLTVALFLANILAMTAAQVNATDPKEIFMIDIIANGSDQDISSATTFIQGKIEFDKITGEALGEVEFHVKIYDDSNKKIYSMKGKLKAGGVMFLPQYYCPVRNVIWTNLWLVMGIGVIKTSDTDLTIDYRGQTITLPNTGGKYIPATIMLLVNPTGEFVGGVDELGGWAFAGIPGFGGITYLIKYFEK